MRYLTKTLFLFLLGISISLTAVADGGRMYTSMRLSSSLISCLTQDKYGYVWIGTEYGLDRFDGYTFTNYLHDPADSTSILNNVITKFLVDRDGNLWIGSSKGLMRYDYSADRFITYHFPITTEPRVNALVQATDGRILIGTAGYGLFSVSGKDGRVTEEKSFSRLTAESGFYSRLYIDTRRNLWRADHTSRFTLCESRDGRLGHIRNFHSTYGAPMDFVQLHPDKVLVVCLYGIMQYDYRTGRMADAGFDLSALNGNVAIRCAMADRKGDIYIGTSDKGLMRIPQGGQKVEPVSSGDGRFSLGSSNVVSLLKDRTGNLWVGCYNKGLFQMGQSKPAFRNWSFSLQNYSTGGGVSSAIAGDDGETWCTVQNSGVYRLDATGRIVAHPTSPSGTTVIYRDRRHCYWIGTESALYGYEPHTGAYTLKLRFTGRGVNCITDDRQGRLFISDYGKGLCVLDTRTGTTRTYTMTSGGERGTLCNDWIRHMTFDRQGMLWICTADGVSCADPATMNFSARFSGTILTGRLCTYACETTEGMVIGTDEGLFLVSGKNCRVTRLRGTGKLNNLMVSGIATDRQGNLWISSTRGLWQWNRHTARLTSHLSDDGISSREYVQGTVLCRSDGLIGFGTADGLTTFMPDEVSGNTVAMGEVFLTGITAGGKRLDSRDSSFNIPYSDNTVQLRFSLLDFKNTDRVSFLYRIDNSRTWTSSGDGNNIITLNNMEPGRHVIQVRAYCNGTYSKGIKTITVVVDNPWYASTPACIIYLIIIAAIFIYGIKAYNRRKRAELEEAKMRFLINATHDIRSPLTLIMGPLNKLKQTAADPDSLKYIDIIDRNAQRLLTLVNQILDERKIDKHQMQLHCRHTDLAELVGGIYSLFQYNASQRGITFRFDRPDTPVYAWVDRTNFDKVVTNLLSNAFKYTFDGGEITVTLTSDADTVTLAVADTGIGIKEERTERLFERFYQGRNSDRFHVEGTGIGLNLSRAIVLMHGGKIQAGNRADGRQGAVFTVTMPTGNGHLKPEEVELESSDAADTAVKRQPSKNFRIMVVDDDPEISRYISTELSGYYRFDTFTNGKDALSALLTGKYDLVVSDVMMPVMDGITLLRNIKGNTQISETPVILLTSKTDVADRLEGLKRGADAYIAKPFNMEELHVLIDNLIDNVRRLRGKFTGMQKQEDKVENIEVKGNDEALMERIMKSMNKNIADPDFNVERLADDVGMSRAQMHRKMKELTGISTGEFIRNIRLEQAARLLREGKINVTQVTYSIGFNNQTHFSTLFKKHFGMSPSEYAEKMKQKET